MVTVKIGNQEIEATTTPVMLTVDKVFSKSVFVFFINGHKYTGFISDRGRLVISLIQEAYAAQKGKIEKSNQHEHRKDDARGI